MPGKNHHQVRMAPATRTGFTTLVLLTLAFFNCWLIYNSVLRDSPQGDLQEPFPTPIDLVSSNSNTTSNTLEVGPAPSQELVDNISPDNNTNNEENSPPTTVDPVEDSSLRTGGVLEEDPSSSPETGLVEQECDISLGKWIPDPRPPLYTNETCQYIQPSQNCMMNGRPDRGYLDWSWKPNSCELEPLDPARFLEFMRNKKLLFIGDSLARNHMQSLLCALAQVEEPEKIYFDTRDKEMKWGFRSYNFTLNQLWSPFLAHHEFIDEVYHIHLDEPEDVWASKVHEYDVVILSSGYWWFRPSVYYANKTMLGCNPRSGLNYTIFEVLPAYRLAHRYMLRHLLRNFRGLTMLRTLTVDHFEFGSWNTGGLCNRTRPFSSSDPPEMPWMTNEMNLIQVEEFNEAVDSARSGEERLKLNLLNITYSAFMRPDGHPNWYRVQPPGEKPQNDCLHWCLPGSIDTWNQFIWHTLRKRKKLLRGRGIDDQQNEERSRYRLRQFNKQGAT